MHRLSHSRPRHRPFQSTAMDFELAITNGRILDGSGRPEYRGDVGVRGDRISAIETSGALQARRTIDAAGMVVCPGFIDMHTHSDLMPLVEPG